MAGGEGIEPSPTGPEPVVLPLDHPPTVTFIILAAGADVNPKARMLSGRRGDGVSG